VWKYLSSVFLANRARVNKGRTSLAYSLTLGIRAPDYEVDRALWFNEHYEGSYLFREGLVIELVPPQESGDAWQVQYAWQGQTVQSANTPVDAEALTKGRVEVTIPFDSGKAPGIAGQLRFVLTASNADAALEA